MFFSMLVRRRVMPLWEGDPVQRQYGRRWLGKRGRSGISPPDRHWTEGKEIGSGSISKLCNNKQ